MAEISEALGNELLKICSLNKNATTESLNSYLSPLKKRQSRHELNESRFLLPRNSSLLKPDVDKESLESASANLSSDVV